MKTQAASLAVDEAPAIVRVAAADMATAASDPHAGGDGDGDGDGRVALVRARAFAEPLLVGRLLDTGEEAWSHAEGVAQILADLGATPAMQAAAYLVYAGDGLQRPIEVVAKAFGPSYASLVDLTRKLVKIQRAAREAQIGKDGTTQQRALQTERVRKMLLAFSRDLRVVLLRLASRLQTLRWHAQSRTPCPPELARESQQVFAPLANRLGIWQIKWELEDLSFRFLEPEEYRRVAKLLDERRVEREAGIVAFRTQLEQMLAAAGIRADIQGRPKHIYSIWKKMRGKALDFEHVFDIRAVRVIVDDVAACYAVLGRVNERYRAVDGEFDDYIARPKANGYQSLHTVVKDDAGRAFEVQIRTREMHDHAEHGVAAHWAYKEAGTKGYAGVSAAGAFEDQVAQARKAVLRQLLAWERDFAAEPEPASGTPSADAPAFEDRIYVFTPQASVIELPARGTPLDFAYALHTDVGHRCRGARVDGVMVPLQTPLQNGQTVEIVTVREGGPSMDWLNPELHFLQSPRARAKVRAWFNALQHAQTVARGRELVEKLLQREGRTATSLEELAGRLGFDDAEALFEVVGKDEYSLRNIEILLRPAEPPPPDEVIALKRPRTGGAAGGVLVVGIDSLLTTLASCCRPAPPDRIGGYVTRGKGVAVHRTDCSNFRHMAETTPERVIPVQWGQQGEAGRPDRSVYAVDVVVEAQDRQGLLRDISDVLAKQRVNVIGVSSQSTKGIGDRRAFMTFTVEIDSAERLGQVLGLVAKVGGVVSARRR
jgi:GTP pyrophosphokinase